MDYSFDDKIELGAQLHQRIADVLASNNLPPDADQLLLDIKNGLLDKIGRLEDAQHVWLTALDSIPELVFLHDDENRIIRANRSYAEKAGLDVQQLVGMVYWQVFPLLDGPSQGCVKSKIDMEASDKEVTLSSGEVYFMRHRPVIDEAGHYRHSLHIMENITEKSRIHEEQIKLSTAMQQLAESVVILDIDGKISYANDSFYKLFGYIKSDIIGGSIDMLKVAEQDDSLQPPAVLRELRQHSYWHKEVYRRAKDGTALPVLLTASPLTNLQGVFIGYAGSYLDLRQIRAAESNKQLLQSLIDQSSDAIHVIEPVTMRILDVNLTTCNTLGYSKEELLSMSLYDIDPYLNDDLISSVEEQIENNGSALFESSHQHKDGSIFPVEISFSQTDISGKIFGIGIVRDITERKQIQRLLQQTLRAQHALSACNEVLIHAQHESQLLAEMCRTIVQVANYRFSWIGYMDKNNKASLQSVSYAHQDRPSVTTGEDECTRNAMFDCDLGARAVELGTSLIVQNIADNPQFSEYVEYAHQNQFQSYIGLPLKSGGAVIFGVLNIYSTEVDAFSENEVLLLEELAADLAFGICNLRTKEERNHFQSENQKGVEQLKAALISTIKAIGNTVEKRDPYTAGHQNNVAGLAEAIAREMDLDEDIIEGLKLGASIHDIGKIYVPSEILNRPGKLTDAEFSIIKSHPEVGYEIIKDVIFPWPVAEMILQHHERIDGSGYPKGLKGEEIILEARILTVADVVEAITAHRPYRAAHGIDKALHEIEAKRGQFYDATVVDACLRVFRQNGYKISDTSLDS